MYDFGAVVIPADIVSALAAASETQGWLGGGQIEDEHVFIVISAQIGAERKQSASTRRLRSHRCFHPGTGSSQSEHLLRWLRTPPDFHKRFRHLHNHHKGELEAALGLELSVSPAYLCLIEPTEKAPRVRAYCVFSSESGMTMLIPMQLTVLYKPQPYARLPKLQAEQLGKKTVAVIGLGSGGGEITVQLAATGIGKLLLFDGDRIEPENLLRHVATRSDLGRKKTSAMATDLEERDLPTQTLQYFADVVEWADYVRDTLSKENPDLIICATDSRVSRRFMNYLSNRLGIPLVVAGILDDGRIGEVLLVLPNQTACYECVRLELNNSLDPPASDERPAVPYVGGEADDLQSATHRFDVAIVAGLATRAALQILQPSEFERLPTTYLVWGRERSSYPPPFQFDLPLSLNYVTVTRRGDCPVCGKAAPEITALSSTELEAQYDKIIRELDEISN